VTLPLGVRLVHGTRVTVDNDQPRQAPYVICFANGCMSDYETALELIAHIKKGRELFVQAINADGVPPTFSPPLAEFAFAEAYDGPPTDWKEIRENPEKLWRRLRKRYSLGPGK